MPRLKGGPLAGWAALNAVLGRLTRRQVARLLVEERRGRQRVRIMDRLHARLCSLRRDEEWVELSKNGVPGWLRREAR